MNNSIKSFLFYIFIISIGSCKEDDSTNLNEKLAKAISVESTVSAKEYAESDEELHVELDLAQSEFIESLTDKEIAKLKAAVYRFYSTVTVKNNKYYTPLKSGQDINISEDLFMLFKENLSEINQGINDLKARDREVEVQQVTSEYLNSLLK
jgi:hypothetical protein